MHKFATKLLGHVKRNHIFTVVDVGSMGGVEREWLHFEQDIRVIGFEPDDREFVGLKSGGNKVFLNVALSEKAGPIKFHVSRSPGKSSVYPPNLDCLNYFPDAERFHTISVFEIPAERVRTLDDAMQEAEVTDVDFIKLDTQGSELPILRGGLNLVATSLLGAKIEVEFLELYAGQPLFGDVDGFMRSNGFYLMDLRRAFWKRKAHPKFLGKGQLVFGDALYLRRVESLTEMVASGDRDQGAAKFWKLAAVALVYGLSDYAVEVLIRATEAGWLDHRETQQWIAEIKRFDYWRGLRWLPGADRIAYLMRRIEPRLGRSSLGWADGDLYLGNPGP